MVERSGVLILARAFEPIILITRHEVDAYRQHCGHQVTENLTLSLNLNLRAPNHTVRSRAAEQVHSRARQVVYDVTTKGERPYLGEHSVW